MGNDWTREQLERSYVGKMKAVTIPLSIRMKGEQRILEMTELTRILKTASRLAQSTCDCRQKMGNCIDPMDGCLALGESAEEGIRDGWAKEVSLEEALAAMKRTYDAGLVHMAYTFEGRDVVEQVCSCCVCCCHSLSAALRFGYQEHAFGSKYIATQNEDTCSQCGRCVERCQVGARELDEKQMRFDPARCFGCGLCVGFCPTGSISMVER